MSESVSTRPWAAALLVALSAYTAVDATLALLA